MDFVAHAEEAAEGHDQGTPFFGIDVWAMGAADQERLLYVELHDVHFKGVGGYIFPKWTNVVNNAFHLHRAFGDSGRAHFERGQRGESGDAEFIGLVAVSPALFLFGNGILAGGERQAVNIRDLLLAGQVDDTLAVANQVVGGLAHGAESEHAAPSQPPGRRHGRDVGGAVFVQSGDECDRCAELEDRGFDGSVHKRTLAGLGKADYPDFG